MLLVIVMPAAALCDKEVLLRAIVVQTMLCALLGVKLPITKNVMLLNDNVSLMPASALCVLGRFIAPLRIPFKMDVSLVLTSNDLIA